MMTDRSGLRWLRYLAVIGMVIALAGCFDKEAGQRKAFIQFLQNTVMRSGEVLPALSVDQKKQFAVFVPHYMVMYNYSQQINQVMNEGIHPLVETVNLIRQPRDYLTQRDRLRQLTGALSVFNQQLGNAKTQADNARASLKLADDLQPVYEQAYQKIVSTPASVLQPLIPAAHSLAGQLVQVGDFIWQQGSEIKITDNLVRLPSQQQVDQYNVLMASLPSRYQAFNQAYALTTDTLK